MVTCSEVDCVTENYHLRCVDLRRRPVGDWYCDECYVNIETERQICFCKKSVNVDTTIECSSGDCQIVLFHQCCVNDLGDENDDWYCPNCA